MMKNKNTIIVFLVTITFFIMPIKFEKPDLNINGLENSAFSHSVFNILPLLHADDVKVKEKSDSKIDDNTRKTSSGSTGNNKLTTVMVVVLIIWLGLAFFLFRLDRKISKLEKDINEL